MRLPKWLWIFIVILVVSGIVGLGLRLFTACRILSDIADVALIFTLVAILLYVYFTYMLAKDAWTVSASFGLLPIQGNPYHFVSLIRNHSKHSLSCWCKLNATVNGSPVSLDRFYGGETSFDVQPFTPANGHLDIRMILDKAGVRLEELKKLTRPDNVKSQLYMNIEFWYTPVGTKMVFRNPRQPHYFDFRRDILVADF